MASCLHHNIKEADWWDWNGDWQDGCIKRWKSCVIPMQTNTNSSGLFTQYFKTAIILIRNGINCTCGQTLWPVMTIQCQMTCLLHTSAQDPFYLSLFFFNFLLSRCLSNTSFLPPSLRDISPHVSPHFPSPPLLGEIWRTKPGSISVIFQNTASSGFEAHFHRAE